jgi:hypothetical protein
VYFFKLTEGEPWVVKLVRYDLIKDEYIVVKELGFTCKEKKSTGEKYEVIAVMIVDEFASNKADIVV